MPSRRSGDFRPRNRRSQRSWMGSGLGARVLKVVARVRRLKLRFPPTSWGRAREGEAATQLEEAFARFPHPNPPPCRGRGKKGGVHGSAHHSDPPSVPLVEGTVSDL